MEDCPWCGYTNHMCEGDATCDFRTLHVEKEAILQRMREEYPKFDVARRAAERERGKVEQMQQLQVAMDKLFGLQTMAKMLDERFGVPPSVSLVQAGWEKPSLLERVKLLSKIRKLRGAK